MKKIEIVGGGFAGVWAAMSAAAARHHAGASGDMAITVISRDENLVIRPRLYEGARIDMQVPLAPLLAAIDVELIIGDVQALDPQSRTISFGAEQNQRNWDRLILATGSRLRQLEIPGVEEFAFDNDTFDAAARIDDKLGDLRAADHPATVLVVGGGFTGIETAAELRQRLGDTARIILLDRSSEPGTALGENPKEVILQALEDCQIEVRASVDVAEMDASGLRLTNGERLDADMIILTTGLQASPLTACFNQDKDDTGRLMVNEYLKLPGDGSVFVAGDTAHALTDGEHPALMSCQHAMCLGQHVGHNVVCDLLGAAMRPYRQERYVTCLDLGPAGAVFTHGWDRQVRHTGADAKTMKRRINGERIYPPQPHLGAEAIFDFIAFDPPA